jgi:hypothetical protein
MCMSEPAGRPIRRLAHPPLRPGAGRGPSLTSPRPRRVAASQAGSRRPPGRCGGDAAMVPPTRPPSSGFATPDQFRGRLFSHGGEKAKEPRTHSRRLLPSVGEGARRADEGGHRSAPWPATPAYSPLTIHNSLKVIPVSSAPIMITPIPRAWTDAQRTPRAGRPGAVGVVSPWARGRGMMPDSPLRVGKSSRVPEPAGHKTRRPEVHRTSLLLTRGAMCLGTRPPMGGGSRNRNRMGPRAPAALPYAQAAPADAAAHRHPPPRFAPVSGTSLTKS